MWVTGLTKVTAGFAIKTTNQRRVPAKCVTFQRTGEAEISDCIRLVRRRDVINLASFMADGCRVHATCRSHLRQSRLPHERPATMSTSQLQAALLIGTRQGRPPMTIKELRRQMPLIIRRSRRRHTRP